MMTLAELRALCERATQGKWYVSLNGRQDQSGKKYGCDLCARVPKEDQRPWQSSGWVILAVMTHPSNPSSVHDPHAEVQAEQEANADFIAAARTWLPALIEVAEAAQHLLYGPGITDIGCDGVCYSLVQIDTMLWIECVGCGKKKMLNSNDLHSHTVDCLVLRAEAALARLDETGRP